MKDSTNILVGLRLVLNVDPRHSVWVSMTLAKPSCRNLGLVDWVVTSFSRKGKIELPITRVVEGY